MNPPWVLGLSDGRAGNARQAVALARAIDGRARECTITPRAPWRWAAPRRLPGAMSGLASQLHEASTLAPALVVGCGRQAALATRLLRTATRRVVQVLDPRLDPRLWDLVVVPEHDTLRGENVITLCGSLHEVDDAWLADARRIPFDLGGARSATLLLVGGPTRHAPLSDDAFRRAIRTLCASAQDNGERLLTTISRRTPAAWSAALEETFAASRHALWRDERDGPNPYASWLAQASRIVATPDSVNMLSEACATRVPVQLLQAPLTGRIATFVESLRARRRLAWLGEDDALDCTPLRETARVAAEVRARLDLGDPLD